MSNQLFEAMERLNKLAQAARIGGQMELTPALAQDIDLVLGAAGHCEPMDPDAEGWSEWVHPVPGYLMQCCDCGLVHEMEFAIAEEAEGGPANTGESVERGVIIFRARRLCAHGTVQ